jgi:hypothetical protein
MNLNTGGWASPLLRLLARLRSDGVNSTTPVTEINGGNISAANADIALVAKGAGATLAQVPDGTAAGGNKRGSNAVDWQMVRTGSGQVASGLNSAIGGGSNNSATASSSYVGGGSNNTASGNGSFVGGGASNSTLTNSQSTICGGSNNTASGGQSFVGGGLSNTASGSSSTVCGGDVNTANGPHSFIGGGRNGTTRSITGNHVFPACNAPVAATAGASQATLLILGRQTLDATATVLASNSNTAATTNQVTLPNNSAYSFSGEVIAGVTGAGNAARWTIDGAIKRGANAASTVMVGTPTVTMTHNDAGASAWVVAVTADTTLGCITVTVTGAAATTIRWVCRIETTEMTY